MTENKRFILADIGFVYDNEKLIGMKDIVEVMNILHEENKKLFTVSNMKKRVLVEAIKDLTEENEQLQNQIDELEDDNEKYSKSLDKLEDYTKRFIPTKCLNEFKDCKTNRYYWLDHEGNFESALELLNLMDCENEKLKQKIKELEIENEAQSDAINGLQATLCHLDLEEMI